MHWHVAGGDNSLSTSMTHEIPQEPVSFFRWPSKNRSRSIPLAFIPSQHVRFVLASAEMRARESAWWEKFWDRFLTVPDYSDVTAVAPGDFNISKILICRDVNTGLRIPLPADVAKSIDWKKLTDSDLRKS